MNALAMVVMDAAAEDFTRTDGRRSNAMSPERRVLDHLLHRWGICWMTAFSALGYPRQSVYTRVGELKIRVDNEFASRVQMPDDMMAVDKAVLQLRPIRRKVVIHRYIYWVDMDRAARECHMSSACFRRKLDSACETLIDLLWPLIEPRLRDLGHRNI